LKKCNLLFTGLIGLIAMTPAFGSIIYDNGATTDNLNALWISTNEVSDSFTVSSAATVSGISFTSWVSPGYSVTAIDWSISTAPLGGGTVEGSGAGAGVSVTAVCSQSLSCGGNALDVQADLISGLSVSLAPGTYYLNLQNAVAGGQGSVLWDMSNGPSSAYYNAIASPYTVVNYLSTGTNSETFQILGSSSSVPEPASMVLIGSGLAGLYLVRRRRKA
jgi:hypothetical protein